MYGGTSIEIKERRTWGTSPKPASYFWSIFRGGISTFRLFGQKSKGKISLPLIAYATQEETSNCTCLITCPPDDG
uniref:Uncharacterized protein n=1 Tax=Acrobeloides nanus TaxID=290746 RepID=A0A914E0X0_9BILA